MDLVRFRTAALILRDIDPNPPTLAESEQALQTAIEACDLIPELVGRLDRHHAYLSGLSGGKPCVICSLEGVLA